MTSSTEDDARWIAAGRVGRPHGLDGSFHVTSPVARLLEVGAQVRLGTEGSGSGSVEDFFVVRRRAGTERNPIVGLDGVGDRDAALSLRGRELLAAAEDAPALPQGEWWAHQLEGCAVRDGKADVGVVERLIELPSCEALEVRRPSGTPLIVPLVKDAVRDVDVEAKRIDVDLSFLGEDL